MCKTKWIQSKLSEQEQKKGQKKNPSVLQTPETYFLILSIECSIPSKKMVRIENVVFKDMVGYLEGFF